MKVIKDNYTKDIKVDAAQDEYFVCPLCGQKTFI